MEMRGKAMIARFGPSTYDDMERQIRLEASRRQLAVDFVHSNSEGFLIDRLYAAFDEAAAPPDGATAPLVGVVLNPAGFTVGYRALAMAVQQLTERLPVVEVHVSNPSVAGVVSDISRSASAVFVGAGMRGYAYALDHLAYLSDPQTLSTTDDGKRK